MDCSTFTNSGQLGDTVGGWANVVTSFLTFAGLLFAVKQVDAWKKHHAHEARSSAAKDMWLASFRLLAMIRQVRNPAFVGVDDSSAKDESLSAHWARRSAERQQQVLEAGNRFLDAWAVSELFFDDETLKVIESVWREKAQLTGDVLRWSAEVDELGPDSRHAHEKLFGEEPSTRIDQVERDVKATLRRLAVAD